MKSFDTDTFLMLGFRLSLKVKFLGFLATQSLGLAQPGLGLIPCGLFNITVTFAYKEREWLA